MWMHWQSENMSATQPAATINLAVIPGDGIGPEVIAEALKVLEKVVAEEGVTLEQTEYKLGAQHWLETGETLPDEVLADLRTRDAILFGAVGAAPGDTRIPSGIIEREMLLKLRFSLDHFVNLRPSRLYGTVGSPLANPGNHRFHRGPRRHRGSVRRQRRYAARRHPP